MKVIEIKRELGSDIVTREHGENLRRLVEEGWKESRIVVDFGGLQVTSVSFFDEAFGKLALRHGEELLRQKIEFKGLDKFDLALLDDIVASRSREARKRAISARETRKRAANS